MADLTFAPTVIAIASCERAGAADPVQLAFTSIAEAEVVPADGGDPR